MNLVAILEAVDSTLVADMVKTGVFKMNCTSKAIQQILKKHDNAALIHILDTVPECPVSFCSFAMKVHWTNATIARQGFRCLCRAFELKPYFEQAMSGEIEHGIFEMKCLVHGNDVDLVCLLQLIGLHHDAADLLVAAFCFLKLYCRIERHRTQVANDAMIMIMYDALVRHEDDAVLVSEVAQAITNISHMNPWTYHRFTPFLDFYARKMEEVLDADTTESAIVLLQNLVFSDDMHEMAIKKGVVESTVEHMEWNMEDARIVKEGLCLLYNLSCGKWGATGTLRIHECKFDERVGLEVRKRYGESHAEIMEMMDSLCQFNI